MNTKIKKRMKEANLIPYNTQQETDIENFAELIIRECASVVEMDTDYKDCFKWCDEKILEYFGL